MDAPAFSSRRRGRRTSQRGLFACRASSSTDYEHSHSTIARRTRTYLLYPDVIRRATLLEQGYHDRCLVPFAGLKEALSFSGQDLDAVDAFEVPGDESRYARPRPVPAAR